MDVERFYGKALAIAESENDSDVLDAKFVICDFGTNKNKVRINRDTIEDWVSTLINKPFVGKVVTVGRGKKDFAGHCVRVVERSDEDGHKYNDYEFDTSAFGTFTDASIETIDDVECITAQCKVWKRYRQSCEILQKRFAEGTLNTSWEIEVLDSSKDDDGVKVINNGRFIGHCALGSNVPPAYDSSRLLEVASDESDPMVSALAEDSYNILASSDIDDFAGKEDKTMPNEVIVNEEVIEEPVVAEATSEMVEDEPEVSALTENDIHKRLAKEVYRVHPDAYISYLFPEEHKVWVHQWNDDDLKFLTYSYTVTDDAVELSDPTEVNLALNIAQVNGFVDSANHKIAELNAQVAELVTYKTEHDRIEKEAKVAEMRTFANDSTMFTEDELSTSEMTEIFDNLDYASLNAKIAQRMVQGNRENTTVAASHTENEVASLSDGAEQITGNDNIRVKAIRSWFAR